MRHFNFYNYRGVAFLAILAITASSCKDDTTSTTPPSQSYAATYLASDDGTHGAAHTDANLLNAWGIGVTAQGNLWVATNHSSSVLYYDRTGASIGSSFVVPARDSTAGGSPTGVVINTSADFGGAKVIVATEDGILAAWTTGATAMQVAKSMSDQAVYKGLTMATNGGSNFLYATNFREGTIEVFDKNFVLDPSKVFRDPGIPSDFGPFGIATIDNQIFVSYARHKAPENADDSSGPGVGYVDVFNTAGVLMHRLATQGTLNSPWAIVRAPDGFGKFKNAILVGDFGDGRINAYDDGGNYLGQLQDNAGSPITIDGLWGLSFDAANGGDPNVIYFAAGPGEEEHGTFGSIKVQ